MVEIFIVLVYHNQNIEWMAHSLEFSGNEWFPGDIKQKFKGLKKF